MAGAVIPRQHASTLLITRQGLPQPLVGNGFDQVIKRTAAHGLGDRFHIASRRGKHYAARIARLGQLMQQRNSLAVRQVVIEQYQTGLKTLNHHPRLLKITRQPYLAETGYMADIFSMHFRQ
ncbi:hypothetical protein SDC9_142954 [bioreactor metagenome]|uniref:Uncharacterized protein n=1 Tax=bioreactor metagenome TaxID=1076179 RepID=A0A645E2N6_9ZZZZ